MNFISQFVYKVYKTNSIVEPTFLLLVYNIVKQLQIIILSKF